MSSSSTAPILPQSAGYGVGACLLFVRGQPPTHTHAVIGIGLFFSALMIALTGAQARYTSLPRSADEFSSASRTVPSGLVAAAVVSAWTWAATLLQSSAVAYRYGISGPWWYGAGATVQVLLFAQVRRARTRREESGTEARARS
jgi:Na+/proline symporter